MEHMEPIKTWESYGVAEQNTRTTRREKHAEKRDDGGGREVHYGLFKTAGLSFTYISLQQSSLFSLSTRGNKMKEFVWGQWEHDSFH